VLATWSEFVGSAGKIPEASEQAQSHTPSPRRKPGSGIRRKCWIPAPAFTGVNLESQE
jgi:hypothetical protein